MNNPLTVERMGSVVAVVVGCNDMLDADVIVFAKVVGREDTLGTEAFNVAEVFLLEVKVFVCVVDVLDSSLSSPSSFSLSSSSSRCSRCEYQSKYLFQNSSFDDISTLSFLSTTSEC
jgi:hypothetical protein